MIYTILKRLTILTTILLGSSPLGAISASPPKPRIIVIPLGVNSPPSTPITYAIGDTGPAGGVVFFLFQQSGGYHGLEAAPVDQADGLEVQWGCKGQPIIGAQGNDIGTGAQNTADILGHTCSIEPVDGVKSHEAALLASDYRLNNYSDWYLPSRYELYQLSLEKDDVGNFSNGGYWSSSQHTTPGNAWVTFFATSSTTFTNKISPYKVRAIRAF